MDPPTRDESRFILEFAVRMSLIRYLAYATTGVVLLLTLGAVRLLQVMVQTHCRAGWPAPRVPTKPAGNQASIALVLGSGTCSLSESVAHAHRGTYGRDGAASRERRLDALQLANLHRHRRRFAQPDACARARGPYRPWRGECAVPLNDAHRFQFELLVIPRARHVKQSYVTSPWTTLGCLTSCLWQITIRPLLFSKQRRIADVLLLNGPGSCVPVVLCAFLPKVRPFPD